MTGVLPWWVHWACRASSVPEIFILPYLHLSAQYKIFFSSPYTISMMRSSLVVRASDCQCTSCNGPGFDPSIRRHSGIWGAADETVLNIVRKKNYFNLFVSIDQQAGQAGVLGRLSLSMCLHACACLHMLKPLNLKKNMRTIIISTHLLHLAMEKNRQKVLTVSFLPKFISASPFFHVVLIALMGSVDTYFQLPQSFHYTLFSETSITVYSLRCFAWPILAIITWFN